LYAISTPYGGEFVAEHGERLQLVFCLRHPTDFVFWESEDEFNPDVHERLLAAHQLIERATPENDRRLEAEEDLQRMKGATMSRRQQMLRYYLLAQCGRARDLYSPEYLFQVLNFCTLAENLAKDLWDFGAEVDLCELRGTLYRSLSIYYEAAEAFAHALRVLREHSGDDDSYDPEFEVSLIAKAATLDYVLAQLPRAWTHIERAWMLLPLTPTSILARGTIAWATALLYWQKKELDNALQYVRDAAQLYRQLDATNSTCRVIVLMAEIEMDVAESLTADEQATRAEHLAQAAEHLDEAFAVGRKVVDLAGIELANLALARLHRILGTAIATGADSAQDPEKLMHAVLERARRMRDHSLIVAAQTAIGADLLMRGKTARGKSWLHKATKTARSIASPGLALRAERYLWRAEGRNV
jgi:tetratricopeptide (TPR) repeat protein